MGNLLDSTDSHDHRGSYEQGCRPAASGCRRASLEDSTGVARKSPSRRRQRPKEKGMAFVWGAVTMLFLIPLVGLAIDSGVAFVIKTRLSIAVDSACLAAARSLNRGMTLAAQESSARETALRYFYANFPTGDWMTTGADPVVVITESGDRMRTVTVNAVRTAPLYFLPVIGKHYADVGVIGQATRRDSNIILILDRSSSINATGSASYLKSGARSFVDKFSNGRDRMGLVVFHGAVHRAMEPTFFFKSASPSMSTLINEMAIGGNTGTTAALNQGYDMLVGLNEPGALNVIVFFTDGLPNGLVGNFNNTGYGGNPDLLKSGSTCTDKMDDKIGFLAQWGSGAMTGTTVGIFNWQHNNHKNANQTRISNVDGCAMASNVNKMRDDVQRMPLNDIWGNRVDQSFTGAVPVDLTKVDSPYHINQASMNTAIDQARRIRANATLKPVLYCIGLGDESAAEPPDHGFMKKLANTHDSVTYNDAEAQGMYIFVQVADQESGLQEAFQRVAGEIIRLSL